MEACPQNIEVVIEPHKSCGNSNPVKSIAAYADAKIRGEPSIELKSGEDYEAYLDNRIERLSQSLNFCLGVAMGMTPVSLNMIFGMLPSLVLSGWTCHGPASRGGLRHNTKLICPTMTWTAVACLWSNLFLSILMIVLFKGNDPDSLYYLGLSSIAQVFFIVFIGVALVFTDAAYLRVFMLAYHLKKAIAKRSSLFVTLPDDGQGRAAIVPLGQALTTIAKASGRPNGTQHKFESSLRALVTGRPVDAALGVHDFLRASDRSIHLGMAEGIDAIVREFQTHGTDEDRVCLEYVLNNTTGSNTVRWANGVLDEGREHGLPFSHFVNHPSSKKAKLSEAHVLALRLYTTAAFQSLNNPLRNTTRTEAHPLAVTVAFINEGIKRLRAIHADTRAGQQSMDLWRGMRDLKVSEDFLQHGGTEYAPMSTTSDLRVAVQYSSSQTPLLFKVKTTSFMERGADLQFLSAFPGEAEIAFGPLTYLKPTGNSQMLKVGEKTFTVVEVVPSFAS